MQFSGMGKHARIVVRRDFVSDSNKILVNELLDLRPLGSDRQLPHDCVTISSSHDS